MVTTPVTASRPHRRGKKPVSRGDTGSRRDRSPPAPTAAAAIDRRRAGGSATRRWRPSRKSRCATGEGGGGGGKQTGRTRGRTGEGGGCGRKKRDAVRKTQKRCWPRNERVAAGGSGTKPSDGRAAAWGALLCVWTIATARVLSRLKTVGAHPHERGRARRGGRTVAAAAALPAGSRRPGLAADRPRLCPPRRAHARR